jgi:hypothetical protein
MAIKNKYPFLRIYDLMDQLVEARVSIKIDMRSEYHQIRVKVDDIQTGTPESITEIRSFLGLAGYYRKFIKGFLKLVLSLTRKSQVFVWDVNCEKSFQELKKRLTSAPVLILPDPKESSVKYCDASKM